MKFSDEALYGLVATPEETSVRTLISLSLIALLLIGFLTPKFTTRSDESLSSEEVAACRYISRIYMFNHPLDRVLIARQTVHLVDSKVHLVKTYLPFAVPYGNIEIDLGKTFSQAKMEVERYNLENQGRLDERWACDGSTRSVEPE